MGLDMYLTKKTDVKNWDYFKPEDKYEVSVTLNKEPVEHIKTDKIKTIEEEVAYWRKANHLHNWFVKTVQEDNDDCGEYPVSIEDFQKLRELCIQANELVTNSPIKDLEKIKSFDGTIYEYITYNVDNEKMIDILPTASGFFFGNTEYNNDYIEVNNYTIEIIDSILLENKENPESYIEYYYVSSW
jgi:hypothetical protein